MRTGSPRRSTPAASAVPASGSSGSGTPGVDNVYVEGELIYDSRRPTTEFQSQAIYSILLKDSGAFQDSKMNVAGFSVAAGPIFGFVDVISAKNAPYIGTPTAIAFTTGEPDGEWHTMFNINLGFYFKTDPLQWAQ